MMKVITFLGLACWCIIPTQALQDKNLRSIQDTIIKSKGRNIFSGNQKLKESDANYESVPEEFTRTLQATSTPTMSPTVQEFTLSDLVNVLLDIFVASISIVVLIASLVGIEIEPPFSLTAPPTTKPTTSSMPSLAPSTLEPTSFPSASPTESVKFVWKKKFSTQGVQAAINAVGNVLFRFAENGNAEYYERIPSGWSLKSESSIISDVWGNDESNLQISISQNARYVVAGNLDLNEVMVFRITGNAVWTVWGQTISSNVNNFGAYVDITDNGQQLIAAGDSDIIFFDYRGEWQETTLLSTDDFFLGVFMSFGGEEVYYYTLTSVMRYSLPDFDELPSIPVNPDKTIAQIALSKEGGFVFALGLEDMTDPEAGLDRFSTEIYNLQEDNTYDLTLTLPSQLVTFNSMSRSGRALVCFDFTVPFTGKFTFSTFRRFGDVWEKTVTFQPNLGFGFTLDCMLDADGSTFVIAANGNIEAWDYMDVNMIGETAAPTKSASPSISETDIPSFSPTLNPTATETMTPSISPSATATSSSEPSISSYPSLEPTQSVSPTIASSSTPTLIPSSMPTLERNITWSKTFVNTGVEVEMSSDGKTLLLFQASGTAEIFLKDDTTNSWTNVINTNNLGLIWGNLAEAKPKVSMDATGTWIVAGSEVLQQVIVFKGKNNQWELIDIISDTTLSDFGKFVGVSSDGNHVLAGGQHGLMSFEFRSSTSTYNETGRMNLTSDDILDALFTVSGDTAFYYTETSFNHVSIPDFGALPTLVLESNVGIAQASFSADATTVVLSTYDMNATKSSRQLQDQDMDDYYTYYGDWDRFNLFVYTLDGGSTALQGTFRKHFAAYNSISGDGTRMVTRDLSTETDEGFEFASWLLVGNVWEKTGTFRPDRGESASYDCVVDESGFTFAFSFGGLVNVWEAQ